MKTLETRHLFKQYHGKRVVNNVSLCIHPGEIVGLLGPNGAGKTSCFYMILGLVRPDAGDIFIDAYPLTHLPVHSRAQRGIGYLPQEASVFRKMSVEDNIAAILETRSELSRDAQKQTLEHLLQEFKITPIRHTLGYRLSGGERRRVEIARALATEPKFILLDEPFAGVDPLSIIDIKAIILQLAQKGIGVLITDHNVRETLDTCQRAYIMNEGQVIAEGSPEYILEHAEVRRVYLGEAFKL